MSVDFTLPGARLPAGALPGVLRAVGDDLDTLEAGDPWPPGLRHVFRRGVSTRCVELAADERQLGVRVLTCSSPEDYALALGLVRAVAALAGVSPVVPDGDHPVAVGDLAGRYGEDWARDQIASGANVVARLVDEQPGRTVTLDGPNRPFHVGGRLLGDLRASGAPEGVPDRLVAAMRRTQWPAECYAASVMDVGSRSGGPATRIAVLTAGSRTLLPWVDVVALHDASGLVYVPAEVVPVLLPRHAAYLDEHHLLVEPVGPDAWAAVLIQAAAHATDLP